MDHSNPPSEREWTIEEQEAFFASQDAFTGLLGGGVASNWTPSEVLPPITLKSLQEAYANIQESIFRGIHITSIVPPESGWPIALHCPLCKETTFLLSPWAVKPTEADYIKMNDTCANDDFYHQHNMELAMRPLRVAVPKSWVEKF